MTKGVINLQKESGGVTKITSTDGVGITELVLPESGELVNKDYVNEVRIGLIDYGYVAKDYHIVAFGGEFNRADYPKLWADLQANPSLVKTQAQWQTESTANDGICGFFSDGNGTTTFRVPNLDKAFLRPDSRGVASYQVDDFKTHSHGYGIYATSLLSARGGDYGVSTAMAPTSVGGAETRPKNIAVLPLLVAMSGVCFGSFLIR